MLLILGTFRIPPRNLSAAMPAMRAMIDASRAEDGCVDYGYAQDLLEPGLIQVREVWRDRATLDRHFASPHIAAWRAVWPALGIGDRNLRLHALGDAEPI